MSIRPSGSSPDEVASLGQLRAEIERENELARSLAMTRSVLDAVADAILVVDETGAVASVNRRFIAMWRVPESLKGVTEAGSKAELLIHHAATLTAKPESFLERTRQLSEDKNAVATDEIELADGRTISRYTSPVQSGPGEIRARVWSFRDVTEARGLAARRAVVAERMTSVGQLVGSVAHEINNPLAYIAGNLDVVVDALGAGTPMPREEMLEALEDARTGVERIKVIVRDLRTLSRMDDETRESIDVRTVLETALQMAHNELYHRARVVRNLRSVPLVSANSVRLTQVFLNLLMNAAHAIPDGRASENSVTITTSPSPLGGASIEISDTGGGIAPAHLERIFDPFFTTKPVGAGTGLGLTICKGIVEKLGGTIEVESRPGIGTTFTVELPPSTLEPTASPRVSTLPAPPPPKRSVLVIDDDARIRRWFERVLAHHDLIVAPSVEIAEDAIKTGSFDVIFCDVMMPDRTGMDMHEVISSQRPDLLSRVVFMSGGAFTPVLSRFLETVPNLCLRKPFEKEALERAIERVVAAG